MEACFSLRGSIVGYFLTELQTPTVGVQSAQNEVSYSDIAQRPAPTNPPTPTQDR